MAAKRKKPPTTDAALRALYDEYHTLVDARRLNEPYDADRLRYVNKWIDALERAEAFMRGEYWTKHEATDPLSAACRRAAERVGNVVRAALLALAEEVEK